MIHGDQYDVLLKAAHWLGPFGDRPYDVVHLVGLLLKSVFGYSNGRRGRSSSAAAKWAVKSAILRLGGFDEKVSANLEAGQFDGIVCGHLHRAEQRDLQGFVYLDSGDWLERCTAVVERNVGQLEIRHRQTDVAAP